jgi:hypothetical protein
MKNPSDTIGPRAGSTATRETTAPAWRPLEVNVLFTDAPATAAAMKSAVALARDLQARICLRAGLVVPWQVPLDSPLTSVSFTEKRLERLAARFEQEGVRTNVELYLCRAWIETLAQVLKPNSLVVIGVQKRWWSTAATRMARALRSQGHRVVLVECRVRGAAAREAESAPWDTPLPVAFRAR